MLSDFFINIIAQSTDLNGDNFVDTEDMNVQDNNRNRSVIQP